MCRFIETIRIENGERMCLPYHQMRVDSTLRIAGKPGAKLLLAPVLTDMPAGEGTYKARIVYGPDGRVYEKSCSPYSMRKIERLQLVKDDNIDYSLKFEDRSALDALRAMRGNADEIIIVKNKKITDTSYSNLALFDGIRWVTPRDPLLKGTMRQRLIDEGVLAELDIEVYELGRYRQVCLINAMMPLGKNIVEMSEVRGWR